MNKKQKEDLYNWEKVGLYECRKENQKDLDELNIKSKCCNTNIIVNSLDEWFCGNCGKELLEIKGV